MFPASKEPQSDLEWGGEGRIFDIPADVMNWGGRWLQILTNHAGLVKAWIARVNEHHEVHWVLDGVSESLPRHFSSEALQSVVQHGRIFTFSDHVELTSGGLFPLVLDGRIGGVLGLLSNKTDYFNTHNIAWIRTMAGIMSDGLLGAVNVNRIGDVEQSISRLLQSNLDVRNALPAVLELLADVLRADAITVLYYKPSTHRFELLATQGLDAAVLAKLNLYFETGMAERSYSKRNRAVWIEDLQTYPADYQLINRLDEDGFRGYGALPLIAHNNQVGVLEIAWRVPQHIRPWTSDFLERVTEQIALAMDRTEVVNDLRHNNSELAARYNAMIEGLSRALELRDLETEGHTRRVGLLTMRLVDHMQIPHEQRDAIRQGALLHDIGKIGIPDAILLKPGSLTSQERKVMQQHVVYGYNILAPIISLRQTLDIVLYHHERWDGLGYPHKLKGEQIPLVARMFSVVDVFDALTSDRPYRPAWSATQALEYLKEQAGHQFDPEIVALFLEIVR